MTQTIHNFRQREVRLYLCALAQDMQKEREIIHTQLFPKLQKFCENKRISFSLVDLRNSLKEESKDNAKILQLCFNEIDRCRPFFIGILGEQYGTIPVNFPEHLVEKYPWLRNQTETSVLELEIQYGVLNFPSEADKKFLYFRNPNYINTLPLHERPLFQEKPTPEEIQTFGPQEAQKLVERKKQKLADLKNRLRWGGFNIYEYSNIEEFANKVFQNISDVVTKAFPCSEAESLFEQEKEFQEAFLVKLPSSYFFPRERIFRFLTKHVEDKDGPLIFFGPSGSGKTTILANWLLERISLKKDESILFHFCGLSKLSGNLHFVARRLIHELKLHYNVQRSQPTNPESLFYELSECLNVAAENKKIILVLDGLSETSDPEHLERFLQSFHPSSNVRVIVSLDSLPPKVNYNWRTFANEPLESHHRRQFIENFCSKVGLFLPSVLSETICKNPASASPLYLSLFLKEMQAIAGNVSLEIRAKPYLQTKDPMDLLEKIFDRIVATTGSSDESPFKLFLAFINYSNRGLTEDDILNLIPKFKSPLERHNWFELLDSASMFVYSISGFFVPFHKILQNFIEKRLLTDRSFKNNSIEKFINFFANKELSPRVIDELPQIYFREKLWDKLFALVSDPIFLNAYYKNYPIESIDTLKKLEKNSNFRLNEGLNKVLKKADTYINQIDSLTDVLEKLKYYSEADTLHRFAMQYFKKNNDYNAFFKHMFSSVKCLTKIRKFQEAINLLQEAENLAEKNPNYNLFFPEIIISISELFQKISQGNNAIFILERLKKFYEDEKNESGLANCLGLLATANFKLGLWEKAISLFKEQEMICRKYGNKQLLVDSILGQAVIMRIHGELDASLTKLKEAEKICRDSKNKEKLHQVLTNLAQILNTKGDPSGALHLLSEAESICRETGDKNGLQATLGKQAQILRIRGDLDSAMMLYKEQELICREDDIQEGLQIALGGQAVILKDRGRLDDAIKLSQAAEKICRDIDYKEGLQRILGNQAMILRDRGELDRALGLLREAEKICREFSLKPGLQRILEYLALVLKAKGDLDGAMALFREQEQICRELGIKIGLQSSLGNQAHIYYFQGELEKAMSLYKEQEKICRELGLKERLQISLGGQALIHRSHANFDQAIELLKEQEKICLELGLKSGLQASMYNQGIIYLTKGNLDLAFELFKEQEKICREFGYKEGLQASLGSQAVIKKSRGELKQAMELFDEQEKICRTSGYKEGLQIALCGKAAIFLAQGNLEQALDLLHQGEKICRTLNHKEGIQRILCSKAIVYQAKGEFETAFDILKEAETICRALDYKSGLQRILENQAIILEARGQMQEAIQLLKEQETLCRNSGILAGLQAALYQQAVIQKKLGNFLEALNLLKEQEELCLKLDLKSGLAKCLALKAEIMAKDPECTREAMYLVARAFRLAKDHGFLSLANTIRTTFNSIQNQYLSLFPNITRLKNIETTRKKLEKMANLIRPQEYLNKTFEQLEEEGRVFRQSGQLKGYARSLSEQANILRKNGNFEEAVEYYGKIKEVYRRLGDLAGVAEAAVNQALIFIIEMNKHSESVPYIEEAIALSKSPGLSEDIKETIQILETLVLPTQKT